MIEYGAYAIPVHCPGQSPETQAIKITEAGKNNTYSAPRTPPKRPGFLVFGDIIGCPRYTRAGLKPQR